MLIAADLSVEEVAEAPPQWIRETTMQRECVRCLEDIT